VRASPKKIEKIPRVRPLFFVNGGMNERKSLCFGRGAKKTHLKKQKSPVFIGSLSQIDLAKIVYGYNVLPFLY
jgi:hypothetical protein